MKVGKKDKLRLRFWSNQKGKGEKQRRTNDKGTMGFFDTFKMTCRDVTYLHEKKREGKLSFAEMIGMRLHLLYCKLCRLFFKQLDGLEKQSYHLSHTDKISSPLDNSAKDKMRQALADEMKK
jgi:hypothetical protein